MGDPIKDAALAKYWRKAYETLVAQTGRDLNDGLGIDPRKKVPSPLARAEGPHPEQIAENANCSSPGQLLAESASYSGPGANGEWVMVPREPTEAMLDAATYFWGPWLDEERSQRAGRRDDSPEVRERGAAVWEQMIRAASPSPLEGAGREDDAELMAALQPFGEVSGEGDEDFPDNTPVTVVFGRSTNYSLKLGHFRRAAALTGPTPEGCEHG